MKKYFCTLMAGLLMVTIGCTTKKEGPSTASSALSQAVPQTDGRVELIVSAASSLKDCMNEIKNTYAAVNPNMTILYNFGGSGTLQQQIEQGAPGDIFFSAGKKQMKALQDKNIMENDSVKDLLINKIVLITPKNGNMVTSFSDLKKRDITRIAIGDIKTVPAGQYAQQVFDHMGLTNFIKYKLVYAQDVRQVLSWVETENVQAGVVYATDVTAGTNVKVSSIAPEGSHEKIIYPVGVVKESRHKKEARQFIQYLTETGTKSIFKKFGFSIAA